MDPNGIMTQGEKMHASFGRILLFGAGAIALVAVGYRLGHGREEVAPAAAVAAPDVTAPDAVSSYEKAVAAKPSDAFLWSALGEARVMASKRDPMPAPALEAFRKALAIDPRDPRARYFMAVKRDLDGDHQGALADWLVLLADTPKGAPWEADLKRTIEQVGKINKIDTAPRLAEVANKAAAAPLVMPAIPGPSARDLQAATAMSPSEQRQMAEGMVARLEAKLKAAPTNPEGWVMLIRSRVNLGQRDKAAQALKDAIAANPGDADALRQQAGVLGVR
jgi:cytochrome c-type biogenesis protein CcmH